MACTKCVKRRLRALGVPINPNWTLEDLKRELSAALAAKKASSGTVR